MQYRLSRIWAFLCLRYHKNVGCQVYDIRWA